MAPRGQPDCLACGALTIKATSTNRTCCMQRKWSEDLLAVAEQGSFKPADESRQVTAPAFDRRLRDLEQWAGVLLFES